MDLIIKQSELEQRWLIKWTQEPRRKEKKKAWKTRESGQICQRWCKALEVPNASGGTKGGGERRSGSAEPASNNNYRTRKTTCAASGALSKGKFQQPPPIFCDEQTANEDLQWKETLMWAESWLTGHVTHPLARS